jgi:hypothetical protein
MVSKRELFCPSPFILSPSHSLAAALSPLPAPASASSSSPSTAVPFEFQPAVLPPPRIHTSGKKITLSGRSLAFSDPNITSNVSAVVSPPAVETEEKDLRASRSTVAKVVTPPISPKGKRGVKECVCQ